MPPEETTLEHAAEPLQPLISSPFEFDVGVVAKLGVEARSVEIVFLSAPEEAVGLPRQIPVALTRGENPGVESVASLIEEYRLYPCRKTGTAAMQTFAAFCDLVNRHKTGDSAIFCDADWKAPSFTAVIDYHEKANGGCADNARHRVHYAFPLSEEWQKWIEKNGKPMTQEDFAWFLEDRIPELSSPTDEEVIRFEQDFATTVATPSQIVQLSRGLQVNVGVKVKTMKTLQTGEGQIAWEESHTDGDGKPLKVPGIFVLSIAPFFMGDKIRVPVRLRYRPAGEKGVVWFYEIYRPDLAITEHVRNTLAEAREKTGLPTFEGAPES